MIIDSHAHYAHFKFGAEFPYVCENVGTPELHRSDREGLFAEMRKNNIVGVIEPSIGFDAIESQGRLAEKNKAFVKLAVGVHPTRCIRTDFKLRKRLLGYAERYRAIAIGETGLDYHYPRSLQHRLRQKLWFVYQIKLAHRLSLPLVLHIRDADEDALKLLGRYKKYLHGGVAHCFTGESTLAKKYIDLGFAIGIGGKILNGDDEAEAICDAVKHVPLASLLVETDAPLVIPEDHKDLCRGNCRKKLCNSSLILPSVIRKIASVRTESCDTVENAIFENTLRVFGINFDGEGTT